MDGVLLRRWILGVARQSFSSLSLTFPHVISQLIASFKSGKLRGRLTWIFDFRYPIGRSRRGKIGRVVWPWNVIISRAQTSGKAPPKMHLRERTCISIYRTFRFTYIFFFIFSTTSYSNFFFHPSTSKIKIVALITNVVFWSTLPRSSIKICSF